MSHPDPADTWETVVKMILQHLNVSTTEDVARMEEKLLARLEKLETLVQKHQTFLKKEKKKKKAAPARRVTAAEVVEQVIQRHPDGMDFKSIIEESGFEDKKLRNIVYRLDKQGKIKRLGLGRYIATDPDGTVTE